jgi:hypothetical protein
MAAGNSRCFTAPSCRLSPAESPSIKPRGQLLTPPLADNSPCPLGDDKTTPLSPPPLAVVSLGSEVRFPRDKPMRRTVEPGGEFPGDC